MNVTHLAAQSGLEARARPGAPAHPPAPSAAPRPARLEEAPWEEEIGRVRARDRVSNVLCPQDGEQDEAHVDVKVSARRARSPPPRHATPRHATPRHARRRAAAPPRRRSAPWRA